MVTGSPENLIQHQNNTSLTIQIADINDANTLKHTTKGVEWFFHLAARADIVPSIEKPLEYFRSNVSGTIAVLKAAREQGVERFLYAASSSCYGIPDIYPTPETVEIKPQYPYALTNGLAKNWCCIGFTSTAYQRYRFALFNVYGPRHRTAGTYGAMFGVFLAQKLANAPYTIVGDGTQIRDFTYVTDVADAFAAAAASPIAAHVLNVGSGRTYSVNYVAELLKGAVVHIPKRPGEPDCTWADISKITGQLSWRPKVTLEEGIAVLLQNIEQWRDAPVWTPDTISKATREWFDRLGSER